MLIWASAAACLYVTVAAMLYSIALWQHFITDTEPEYKIASVDIAL